MAELAEQITGENTGDNTGDSGNLKSPWAKGQSGNPGGRPKGLAKAVRDMAVEVTGTDGAELLAKIAWAIIGDTKEQTSHRLAAWKLLAERGWGKPAEFVPIEDADPLDFSETESNAIVASFTQTVADISEKREKRRAREAQAAPPVVAEAE